MKASEIKSGDRVAWTDKWCAAHCGVVEEVLDSYAIVAFLHGGERRRIDLKIERLREVTETDEKEHADRDQAIRLLKDTHREELDVVSAFGSGVERIPGGYSIRLTREKATAILDSLERCECGEAKP